MPSAPQNDQWSRIPTIHIISDSVGATAQAVARAAAAQFGVTNPRIETLPKVKSYEEVRCFLDRHAEEHRARFGHDRMLLFYTLVNTEIREKVSAYLEEHDSIVSVDLMTNAVDAIAMMSGLQPTYVPGSLRVPDVNDGRNPEGLTQADIVLIGVSRCSKTPLSIYLSQQGYKVANVPLDPTTEPPRQIYDVDRTRLFGLMTTPEVLVDIRRERLGKTQAAVAGRYADLEYVYEDLERARAVMRKLGCIIVHTEKRAVEETAQEILRYYERSHPSSTDIIE